MSSGSRTAQTAAAWLSAHLEDHVEAAADLNQYWYSASTIATLCDLVREQCFRSDHSCALDCAFLSTPSLFFALTPAERARSRVLDFDEALGVGEPGFVRYNFHEPTALPPALAGAFRCVVIDPPFITVDVWRRYIETARHLLQPSGGVVILTTVIENAGLLAETLGVTPHTYLPSIPNLPYQYALFTNFSSAALDRPNPEVPHDPATFVAAAAAAAAAPPPAEAEAPVTGAGHSYDFEAMLDAELRRQAQS